MTILDKIIAFKQKEVEAFKANTSIASLEQSSYFNNKVYSLKAELAAENSTGIIAEYKRQSPSKGIINNTSSIEEVTKGYLSAGVAAQSILTDLNFFGGTNNDLKAARLLNQEKPILRKDFIVDEFQIIESKAIGADVILLIATCLSKQQIKQFGTTAQNLGLEVLYEVHSQEDLDKIELSNKIIGINNRNLKTFKVDLAHSIALANQIPESCVKVSESGISKSAIISDLKGSGFQGFLIGENFMKSDDPAKACQNFINELK